ncbi:aldo/keto reductase [Verrucomicrobiaceae bacterium R5-34]|uniref:Aldo/keto reductase n=1 Tax=Oceaniferula flava TaxID=2800421 RepID=A0AAE2SC96_9BACT|nr:aldo/keto reductase [Oceaniferula flavus]MBK1829949.1 aldo/keto reductase [Verrucomicrobiaceae bacterium R5-34]MBK1855203.1 aldo/keto reductase [Oceaniferula flavus]MBM1136509.1 aldo/keto reductase [Oceaniferula flavus]
MTRRELIRTGALLGIGTAASQMATAKELEIRTTNEALMKTQGPVDASEDLPTNKPGEGKHYRPKYRMGLGGLAAGNGFNTISTDEEILEMLHEAWDLGVRHFDTSPFYGLSLSERRFGDLLRNKKREDYVLSSKVGRLLTPSAEPLPKRWHWANHSPFHYRYDYTAAGTRRSIEDSLHRMGVSSLDIVYIHDLSPQNSDMGKEWTKYYDEAVKGAIPELTKMREEGIIKGWGFGVNTPDVVYKSLDICDPDICLLALQYSIMDHKQALEKTFPILDKRDISVVVGAPLNGGFVAGRNRYNYSASIPPAMKEKFTAISAVAKKHGVDTKTAALQFAEAPSTVSAIIPGARTKEQIQQNIASMKVQIPAAFWSELKAKKLIEQNAATPA